jgi:hypothetical protein
MTAIVLPDIDRSTLDELKKRIPDLSEIELPNLPSKKEVSRTADQAIDRLLGRSRTPIWAWVAAAVGLAAVIGVVAAWFAWFRRPTWESTSEPYTDQATADASEPDSMTGVNTWSAPIDTPPVETAVSSTRTTGGSRTASQRSSGIGGEELASSVPPYPIEEA